MFRKSRTYYKYLLSYLALLLAAVLVLVLFSQAFFIVQLRDSLVETHRSRLRQTVQQLEDDIQQIYTIDYQISSVNENFLSYYLAAPGAMRDMRLVNELHNLLAPATFIAEMALVEQDTESVYTSSAVYAKELFFSGIFSFDAWDDPQSDLTRLHGRIVRPAERVNGSQRYITFINAASVFSRLQDTVQLYFVKESHFLDLLAPAGAPTQQGAIWDSEGQIIVSTVALDAPVTGDRVRLEGVDCIVLTELSPSMGWTYAFFLPSDEFFAPITRAQVTLFVFLLALLVSGALVIHYAMQVNYKPLKELTEQLGADGSGDELNSLRDVLDSLSQQNAHMRAQLMCSPDGQALKDTLLFALLKGKFDSFDAFNQEAAPLDMHFDCPCYHVLMLRHYGAEDGGDPEVPRTVLQKALSDALGPDYTFYFRELFEASMIVCLVGMRPEQEDDLRARCLTLLDALAQEHGHSFTIGMSDARNDVAHITAACFEATQAVREHFIRGRHQLIRYSELDRTLSVSMPEDPTLTPALNDLRQLTAQTREQQADTLRRFVSRLKEERVPALLAKSYCNAAVEALIAANGAAVSMDDLFTISYLRTADDYLAFMLHLLQLDETDEALPGEHAEPDAPVPELLGRIYDCIAERFDDCNFSIQEVAGLLNLSGSYLSQYFKQQTGDTLTSHVAALRIRKACTLLETTNMPLQMISESVGYYNQNSFIRRFKQITGVTPGEYRRGHQ